jgi:hypothetical protein
MYIYQPIAGLTRAMKMQQVLQFLIALKGIISKILAWFGFDPAVDTAIDVAR